MGTRQGRQQLSGGRSSAVDSPQRAALDRELAELERKKMVALRGGAVTLTLDGYRELVRKFPRGRR